MNLFLYFGSKLCLDIVVLRRPDVYTFTFLSHVVPTMAKFGVLLLEVRRRKLWSAGHLPDTFVTEVDILIERNCDVSSEWSMRWRAIIVEWGFVTDVRCRDWCSCPRCHGDRIGASLVLRWEFRPGR